MLLASQFLESASASLSSVVPAKPVPLAWTGSKTKVGRAVTKSSGATNLRIPTRPAAGTMFKLPSSPQSAGTQDLVLYNDAGTAIATVQPANVITGGTAPNWLPFFWYDEDDAALWVMARDSAGHQLAKISDTTGAVTKIGAVGALAILSGSTDFGVAYTTRKADGTFRFYVNGQCWDMPATGGNVTLIPFTHANGAAKWNYDGTLGFPYVTEDESLVVLKRFAPYGGATGQESMLSLCVDAQTYNLISHVHAKLFGVDPALSANNYSDVIAGAGNFSPGFVGMKIGGKSCVWFPIVAAATNAIIPWCLYERAELDRVLKDIASASFGV